MARTESRTKTSIWSDDDFRKLSAGAQRMYWMLYSQPTINLCGVLALTLRRWASSAAGETVATVEASLAELAERGYVVVDWDTEEVWVRTFIRHDGVGRSPGTLAAAWRQLSTVGSRRVRRAAAAALSEFGSPPDGWEAPVGVDDPSDLPKQVDPSLFDTHPPSHPDTLPATPEINGETTPPDTQPGTLRGRARAVSSLQSPVSSLQSPVSSLQSPVSSLPPPDPATPPQAAENRDRAHSAETKTQTSEARVRLELAHAVADACHGTNRARVNHEAAELVVWAAPLDRKVVEEAVGWAGQQPKPPDLPRALAPVIASKAADRRIRLGPFQPSGGRRLE